MNNSPAKKPARLGRGLGSLLGGAADFNNASSPSTPAQSNAVAIEERPARPASAGPAAAPTAAAVVADDARIWKLPIEWLRANTQQPRQVFEPEALAELAASIRVHGILQPITVRRLAEKTYEIIAGERRWRAAQAAGLLEVPAVVRVAGERDSLELAIIENIQRSDLNPMDEAEAYQNLISEYGLTQQEVADRLGKERSSVANSLRYLSLAADAKALLRARELTAGHAKALASISDPVAQGRLARQVVTERLSVRQTEKLAAASRKMVSSRATPPTSGAIDVNVSQRLIEGLAGELQKLIGTKVTIDYASGSAGGKGKLSVHFYSDDQLSELVDSLRRAWQK
jgi:ParB family chromosome partitioning protein